MINFFFVNHSRMVDLRECQWNISEEYISLILFNLGIRGLYFGWRYGLGFECETQPFLCSPNFGVTNTSKFFLCWQKGPFIIMQSVPSAIKSLKILHQYWFIWRDQIRLFKISFYQLTRLLNIRKLKSSVNFKPTFLIYISWARPSQRQKGFYFYVKQSFWKRDLCYTIKNKIKQKKSLFLPKNTWNNVFRLWRMNI